MNDDRPINLRVMGRCMASARAYGRDGEGQYWYLNDSGRNWQRCGDDFEPSDNPDFVPDTDGPVIYGAPKWRPKRVFEEECGDDHVGGDPVAMSTFDRLSMAEPPSKLSEAIRRVAQTERLARIIARVKGERRAPASDPGLAPNPKEACGLRKPPTSVLPWPVLMEVGRRRSNGTVPALAALHVPTLYLVALGLAEGALKYGRHNYRVVGSILGSVYFDATGRHIDALLVGQDTDSDSGLYHGIKAICSTAVLYDAILKGTFADDRPPHQRYLFVDDFEGSDDTLLTYCGQAKRSMAAWWEGGDRLNLIDALDALFALCESHYEGTLIDDRTTPNPDFMEEIQMRLDEINERIPPEKRLPVWTQKRVDEARSSGTMDS